MNTSPEKKYTWTTCPDPQLQVNSVAISDDGSRCVFGTSNEFADGKFATYCCDGNGNLQWTKKISETPTYQGIFWTAISGDGKFVAVGGENGKSDGFLKAYNGLDGSSLLELSVGSRVNQVSLSSDGQYLAACYGSSMEIFHLDSKTGKYVSLKTESFAPYNINSCIINRMGTRAVASGIVYEDSANSTSTKGKVFGCSIKNEVVTREDDCPLPTGAMRVAIVSSGDYWAASLHDGSCVLIQENNPAQVMWQCQPASVDLSLAYAVDVTETKTGEVLVACGANAYGQDAKGLLYLVRSDGTKGTVLWKQPIQRSVNPGVSLDQNATRVTATDGQPEAHSSKETPGTFYLFDGKTGDPVWHYDTPLMNWPMMLSYDGSAVFGGSDDGSVYYWKLRGNN